MVDEVGGDKGLVGVGVEVIERVVEGVGSEREGVGEVWLVVSDGWWEVGGVEGWWVDGVRDKGGMVDGRDEWVNEGRV